jgi:hemerythrin-like domain-containing protein
MREHGVFNRILLIYDEVYNRLHRNKHFPITAVAQAATIVRDFMHNYHEKLEEEHIFTLFIKARTDVDLIKTLHKQHVAGRKLTDKILRLANNKHTPKNSDRQKELKQNLKAFIKMYRVHEAREDTVIFPKIRSLMSAQEYQKLGDIFEKKEHELFGPQGFEKTVAKVAAIEAELCIDDLNAFTPQP